ncbi:uncharacterized protein LOC118826882 [Colossoma macropomum]|uniref:uncharacterized protein LOC118826882 n=1 Tax=Colossoma macropomum TaxID=42526 RepID=UPI0018653FD3|nr:uncharacterized protein LOC118826882 [Colossoma macropomum]
MRNVRKSDSRKYHFQFITNTAEEFTGKPGVILSVTDLQVMMSPSTPSEGQIVALSCISTCTLPNNPTYIWYKNGQPVTNKPTRYNKLYLESASTEDVLQYSCALGESAKGSEAPEDVEESSVLKFVMVGSSVFLALIITTGWMWRWNMIRRKGGAENEADVQTPNPTTMSSDYNTLTHVRDFPNDSYTVLKPTTMSSYYNILTHHRDSPRDAYTTLNPTTMSSDYDTLTDVRSSSSEMYSSLNAATMMSDYDTLTHVRSSSSEMYSSLNSATMMSDYDTLTTAECGLSQGHGYYGQAVPQFCLPAIQHFLGCTNFFWLLRRDTTVTSSPQIKGIRRRLNNHI